MIASGVKRFSKDINRPCENEIIFIQMKQSVLYKQAVEFEIEQFLTVDDYQEKTDRMYEYNLEDQQLWMLESQEEP